MACSNKGKKLFVSRTTRYRIQKEKESSTCVSVEADLDGYTPNDYCNSLHAQVEMDEEPAGSQMYDSSQSYLHFTESRSYDDIGLHAYGCHDQEPFNFHSQPIEKSCGDRDRCSEYDLQLTINDEINSTSESDEDEFNEASTPTQVEWYSSVLAESEHIGDVAHVHDCPLFEGSPISTSANNVLVMEYSMKHNLTNEGLADLLKLQSLLLPTPNNCPRSTHLLRKLFDKYQSFTRSTHYFCNNCFAQVDTCTNLECPKCNVKLANCISSFIQIPMEQKIPASNVTGFAKTVP